jgi:hypothetical protein
MQYLFHILRYRAFEPVYLRCHRFMRVVGDAVHHVQVREENALSPSACSGGSQPCSSSPPGFPNYLGRRARRQAKAFNGGPLPVRDQSAFWS